MVHKKRITVTFDVWPLMLTQFENDTVKTFKNQLLTIPHNIGTCLEMNTAHCSYNFLEFVLWMI